MSQLSEQIRKKDASVFAHGGKFHVDDVFSAALLLYRGNQVSENYEGMELSLPVCTRFRQNSIDFAISKTKFLCASRKLML